jgi:hypothetical protein
MTTLPTLFHGIWDLLPLVVLFLLWLDWDAHSRIDDLEHRLNERTDGQTDGGADR